MLFAFSDDSFPHNPWPPYSEWKRAQKGKGGYLYKIKNQKKKKRHSFGGRGWGSVGAGDSKNISSDDFCIASFPPLNSTITECLSIPSI